MTKRLMPLVLATMCALCVAPQAQTQAGAPAPKGVTPACAPERLAADVTAFSAAERQAYEMAQLRSDPQLGELRGGNAGLVVVLLLIILIIVLVN
ncbi:MAG TPA: hypothetical protein VFY71_18775 [Planctomycetota bacterium]|nr:hypothetical protein [Planctomycetota bacterium]